MKIQELLNSEDKWTQGREARDKDGEYIECKSLEAAKWCLLGAIVKCYPMSHQYKIVDKIKNIIQVSITKFNDTHSYEEVMDLVRKLDL